MALLIAGCGKTSDSAISETPVESKTTDNTSETTTTGETTTSSETTAIEQTHTLEHIDSKDPTLRKEGNIEYYHCTGCDKNFSDEKGTTEVSDVTLPRLNYEYTDSAKSMIYFRFYPQSKVTDEETLASLNEKAGTLPTSENTYQRKDYNYYFENEVSSFMYYIDLDTDADGLNDYRDVYFTSYRYDRTDKKTATTQPSNGYQKNTVYWFEYEPIS